MYNRGATETEIAKADETIKRIIITNNKINTAIINIILRTRRINLAQSRRHPDVRYINVPRAKANQADRGA